MITRTDILVVKWVLVATEDMTVRVIVAVAKRARKRQMGGIGPRIGFAESNLTDLGPGGPTYTGIRALPHTHSSPSTFTLIPSVTMLRTSGVLRSLSHVLRNYRGVATAAPQWPSQAHGHLPTSQSPITSKLHFFNSVMGEGKQIPTFRILDGLGHPLEGAELPEVCCCCSFVFRRIFTKPYRSTRRSPGECGFLSALFLLSVYTESMRW